MASPETLRAIVAEKPFEAERQIAGLRLLVVLQGSTTYLALMDHPANVARLAYTIVVLSWAYALTMYLAQPYRRWPVLVSGYYTVITDSLFVGLWVYATGGRHSPFFITLYLSIFAVAFRYSARESLVASALYAASYLGILAATHELTAEPATTVTRVIYIFFAALMGSLMVHQVLAQARATAEAVLRESATSKGATQAEGRARFLAEASKTLASSLEYEETLRNVARLVVPILGEHCAVDLVEPDGTARRVAEAEADAADEETLRTVLRTSAPVITPHPRKLRTSLSVPLRVHGRAFGAITFGTSSARAYSTEDVRLAEEIALRAAIAIEHARLYRDAQEAIRTRDDFLSIASHELRTPLNVMTLQTDGLLRQAKKENDARLLQPLERTRRQVQRLTALVESLLDVTRVAAGRLTLELSEVDLTLLVADVVARLGDEAARVGSAVVVEVSGPVVGRWDRLRVDQIVTNLVSNAIKYGAGKAIDVRVELAGARARLAVVDRGIGIGEVDQARVFERFERAVSSRHYGGFGLGLWIVRQVVEAHGGTIAIESRLGEGSTFVVELPLAPPPPASEGDRLIHAGPTS